MLLANPLFYSTPTTRRNIPKALQEPETPLICVLLDPGANPYMNPQVGTNLKRSDFSYTFLTLRVHVDALAADPIVDASVTGVAVFAGGCGSSGVRVCGRCHSGAVAALMSVERAAVAKCILFGLNDNYYRLAHCDREARPIPPTPVRGCLGLSV